MKYVHLTELPIECCRQQSSTAGSSYLIIIVTNQSGIARKYYSRNDFRMLSRWVRKQFWLKGIRIQDTFFCPHHPKLNYSCSCRKPRPGMLFRAIRRYNIDAKASIMIGDKRSDIRAALNAKIGKTVLFENNIKPYQAKIEHTSVKNSYRATILKSIKKLL